MNETVKRLAQIQSELRHVTNGCRPDMHEPDEQNLKVRIVGDHLDNATSNRIDLKAITEGFQEYVLCFERFDADEGIVRANINLADLIAMARMARLDG